jgi:hypothetical protein
MRYRIKMNISTYNDLFVEDLFLNGKKFNVENFKGDAGPTPEVDETSTENKGNDGTDWSLRFKSIELTESSIGTYILPDPNSDEFKEAEYTAIYIFKNQVTTGDISIISHDNDIITRFYGPHKQSVYLFVSPEGQWIK